jgi:acetaldehyde dehydrogenase
MVTCGGQSSAPIIQAISKNAGRIDEVEVSSSISALSAGPATRLNIDQYIDSTEHLITLITACTNVKVILVLNPADPPVLMRTTVQVAGNDFDINGIMNDLKVNISAIKNSVPGYVISVEPHFSESNVVSCTAKIEGAGYYLPKYSGNLDIINAAAVETAKLHSRNFNYDE